MTRPMLDLSIALTDNVRTRPVIEGRVAPQGIRLTPSVMTASEMFWRQLKFAEFDVSEMSLSSLFNTAKAEASRIAASVLNGYVTTGLADAGLLAALEKDPMPYGVKAARPVLEPIAEWVFEQGLSPHRVRLDDAFAPSTLDV